MDLSRYDTTFEKYIENIVLTPTQAKIIDHALLSLSDMFASIYEGNVEIYLQGSFATNTTVKPLTANQSKSGPGEFDIDIVLQRSSWAGAEDALGEIKQFLLDDDDYRDKVTSKNKNSCVRVEFPPDPKTGVGFHVDLVPIKDIGNQMHVASRSDNSWQPSDPKKLVEWTLNLLKDNPYMAAHILMIKRIRDLAGFTDLVPSIVILALVAKAYKDTGTYGGDLLNFFEYTDVLLSAGIEYIRIANPVNLRESIIGTWEEDSRIFEAVTQFFSDITTKLKAALESESVVDLQSILSDDFPAKLFKENVDSLRDKGLTLATNGDLKRITMQSHAPHGKLVKQWHWLFFERSKAIKFEVPYLDDYKEVLWQVCNSPQSDKLRGDLFPARALGQEPGTSPDPLVNHESELYLGLHWIRCFIVDHSNQVVAVASRVYVQVMKNAQPSYRQ